MDVLGNYTVEHCDDYGPRESAETSGRRPVLTELVKTARQPETISRCRTSTEVLFLRFQILLTWIRIHFPYLFYRLT